MYAGINSGVEYKRDNPGRATKIRLPSDENGRTFAPILEAIERKLFTYANLKREVKAQAHPFVNLYHYQLIRQHCAAIGGFDDVVQLLLDNKAVVETPRFHGYYHDRMPLHFAAIYGHQEAAKVLILNGASIEAKDDEPGRSPLHYAVRSGCEDLVTFLLECRSCTFAA